MPSTDLLTRVIEKGNGMAPREPLPATVTLDLGAELRAIRDASVSSAKTEGEYGARLDALERGKRAADSRNNQLLAAVIVSTVTALGAIGVALST